MANNIPDYMRDFDLNQDYGFTPVSDKPKDDTTPSVDPKLVEGTNLEISKAHRHYIKRAYPYGT